MRSWDQGRGRGGRYARLYVMFTGLVADVGEVRAIERSQAGARLEVRSRLADDLERGDSIAVSGVCLTAVDVSPGGLRVEVVPQTLERSVLGELAQEDRVNLELPLRAADRLGGHIVQGHVDGVGTVGSVVDEGFSRRVSIRADAGVCRYVTDAGSVTLDGVSLTAVHARADGFDVALIPETLERTTLGGLVPGRSVNIEADVLAKYVERLLRGAAGAEAVATGARP